MAVVLHSVATMTVSEKAVASLLKAGFRAPGVAPGLENRVLDAIRETSDSRDGVTNSPRESAIEELKTEPREARTEKAKRRDVVVMHAQGKMCCVNLSLKFVKRRIANGALVMRPRFQGGRIQELIFQSTGLSITKNLDG